MIDDILYAGHPHDDALGLPGETYQPPAIFHPWVWTLVATLPPVPGSDGYTVELYEMRCPARFHRLVALSTKNSIGREKAGWTLETGSGDAIARVLGLVARAAAEGMIEPGES